MTAPALTAIEKRKRSGAFYTPNYLAQALTQWAIRAPADRVLDPSAGDATFLLNAHDVLRARGAHAPARQLVGVELDHGACNAAERRLAHIGRGARIAQGDFFACEPRDFGEGFDAIIGNPPYIRYHRFRGEARMLALRRAAEQGVRLSALTSSWAPFVVHAASFLRRGGRMGLVLPAELLQVDYAQPVREFLLRRFGGLSIVCFDRAVFPGAQIDAILLLAEDGGPDRGVRLLTQSLPLRLEAVAEAPFQRDPPPRWSNLRVPGEGLETLDALARAGRVHALGEVASIDIGSVTGANEFFLLSAGEARQLALSPSLVIPAVGRPAQLLGAALRRADFRALPEEEKHLLLNLKKAGLERAPTPLGRYLRQGQAAGIAGRYKCRVRKPWYAVPAIHTPDAFLSYMTYRSPRVALNRALASSTNLVHQIVFDSTAKKSAAAYVAALHSSLSHLSFELEGRSYGGGVLKLETREAQRVRIPALDPSLGRGLSGALVPIDGALRRGDHAAATRLADEILLAHGVLDSRQLESIQSTTAALRARRLGRHRKT